MCKDKNKYKIVAFIFDSGKINSSCYGDVVFENMLKNKELCNNKQKMIVSLGDILVEKRIIDLEPYIINDENCTINIEELTNFKDYPYCWIIEDVELNIANLLDARLKKEQPGYIGSFVIDITNTDPRKQFWKHLCRDFSIFKNTITCFEDPKITGGFRYCCTIKELGLNIKYCKEAEFSTIDELKVLQSTQIKNSNNLKIIENCKKTVDSIDRDLMNMNFMLCKELQIAGALIWNAIKDIDKIYFGKNYFTNEMNNHLFEYSFLTLYHASQGVERIQKIIVEMICKKEHFAIKEKQKVFDLLFSHNHLGLNNWISQKENISFNSGCIKLMNIIQKFYTELRYNRFSDNKNVKSTTTEINLLISLVDSEAIEDKKIKLQFGKYLGEIAHIYYKIVHKLSLEMNLYIYELESDSVASIVFHLKDNASNLYEDLQKRQQSKKELLFYILKNRPKIFNSLFNDTFSLEFDNALIYDYLNSVVNETTDNTTLFEDVDYLYDELCNENKNKWKAHLNSISNFIDILYNSFSDEE